MSNLDSNLGSPLDSIRRGLSEFNPSDMMSQLTRITARNKSELAGNLGKIETEFGSLPMT